jgi:hypothetical protein
MLRDYTSGGVYRDSGTEEPPWKFIAAAPIDGGTVSANAWTGDALFVYTTSAAWYLPAADTWKAIVDPAIADLDVVAAAWTGDQLVVLGAAEDPDTPSRAYSLGSPADAICCRRLAAPPFGADHGVLVPTDDGALFIGGHNSRSDEAPFFAAYRPVTDTWIELEPPPLVDGPGLDATWSQGMLVAMDHTLASAWWTPADGWHALPDLPFQARGCYPRSIAFDDSVFVWHCRDAAWLVPESGRWTTIATPELPSHTVSTSCLPLATESTVLLWCGNGDGSTPLLFEAHTLDAGSRNDHIDS